MSKEHRRIINKEVEKELDEEVKEVKIQFDGRQFLIKIPKDFSELLRIKKGDRIKLTVPTPEKGDPRKAKIIVEMVL